MSGNTGSYDAVLTSRPTGDVVVSASSSAVGTATVSPATVTFTTGNWNQPQTFTVNGLALGTVVISHTASGGGYGDVVVPNMDIGGIAEAGGLGGGLGGVN